MNYYGGSNKLYYSPGACSLAPHIAALEAGIGLELVKLDTKTKPHGNGEDFLAINPKGQVPTLVLDNGEVLTEGPVIAGTSPTWRPPPILLPPTAHLRATACRNG